ncbi:MAG: hypothetical protein CMM25_05425, partial [Rhodospirillaceae bacterium]|nr:hypothetical protein [Rhodospirillaceae bacterium]
ITGTSSGIIVEHNIFENGDIGFMQSAPNGFAQTEAIRFTSAPVPTSVIDPMAATNANQDAIDYFVGAGITKLISFSGPHGCEHGQYITINHDTTSNTDQWTGPTSTTNVYQVCIETDSSKLPTYFNTSNTLYLALPSAAQQSPVASEISLSRAPYTYTITRNVNDDSGANAWPKDTAIVNWGKDEGDGYIDITATQGVYAQLGPHISLKARKDDVAGVGNDWLVPEIARLGNLDGTGYTGARAFGLMVGEHLENGPTDATNPFKGLQASDEGVKLYNSGLETYTGSSKTVYLGEDLRSGLDYAGKSAFILGEGIDVSGSNQYQNASLVYAWNAVQGKYVLKLDGAIDIVSDNFYDSPEDIFNNLPNFDMSENPSSSGLYLTPHYLGFYSGNNWPLVIGSSGTNNGNLTEDGGIEAFARIGIEGDSKGYLKYSQTDGLEVSGKITVTNPTNYTLVYQSTIDFELFQTNTTWLKPFGANQVTGIHYIHILALDAQFFNGAVPYYTQNHNTETDNDGSSATWTSLGDAMVGASNQLKWYTFAVDFTSIGVQNSIKVVGNGADQLWIKGLVITTGHPGDPQAILSAAQANELAGNHSQTIYQATQPPGSNYNVGDQWVDTTLNDQVPPEPKNDLWVWNGTAWEATFTQIDGGNITTGTIKGIALESTSNISDGSNTIPRVKLDLGGSNSLKQFNTGILPNRYTEIDGGVLKYVHEGVAGEGVQNSANPLTYELPMAMQLIRAIDLNLGTTFTFNSIGLEKMYSADYQVIPISETQIVTGQQSVADLNTTGGIAREYLEYAISEKSSEGFKMRALLYRGEHKSLVSDTTPTSSDYADNLFNNNNTNYGDQTTGGVFNPADAPQPHSDFFLYNHDLSSGKYTYTEGITNSNLIGGTNFFNVKFTHEYSELVYSAYNDFLGSTYYPGFPGTTHVYYMLRVGEGTGSPFDNDGSFFTVTPVGFGGDKEDDNLKFTLINEGQDAFSYGGPDVNTWPGGSDGTSNANYFSIPKSITRYVQFNSPNDDLIVNPRVELLCFFHRRENSGSIGGYGYHSPTIKDSGTTDDVTLNNVYQGQVPELVEEIEGTGYAGAIVSKWNNISTGDPI